MTYSPTTPIPNPQSPIPNPQSLHELSKRTEIEIEIVGREAELRADLADRRFELHQRVADGLHFLARQRLLLHPPDRLTFHQPPEELDDREHQLRDRALHILGLGVPAQR